MNSLYLAIYSTVARIPRGRVATYGQIAALAGLPGQSRLVGYALHATPDHIRIPWHRVINARGEISARAFAPEADFQRRLLENEGICFDARGKIDLKNYQWHGKRDSS